MLRVNFKMLWQPVMELIKSHADHMTREEFWDVFGKHLDMAADLSGEVRLYDFCYVVSCRDKRTAQSQNR